MKGKVFIYNYLKKLRHYIYPKPNILVFGQNKSGTTALYFKIADALKHKYNLVFEPSESKIRELHKGSIPVLVKNMQIDLNRYFGHFKKKIFITRDPRDRFISLLLYGSAFHMIPETKTSEEAILTSLELIKQKEHNPNSISVLTLFKTYYLLDDEGVYTFFEDNINNIFKYKSTFDSFFVVKYEDMVSDHLAFLEEFLNLKLNSKTQVPDHLRRVERTKRSGSWRHWFTNEDVKFFKPLFKEYMICFNYDFEDWQLDSQPKIESQYASDYMLKLINERRISLGLNSVN